MKLNPEDLDVVSFPAEADALSGTIDQAITVDPNHPTPQTYCFVCD